jgi:peptidyl-prolyl cis-trans isomerase C
LKSARYLALAASMASTVPAQQLRNNVPPETVVATIEGKAMTAAQITNWVNALPGQLPQFFDRDPKEFTKQLAMLLKLAKIAETEKVDQATPYRERLEYARANVLMQSLIELRMNKTEITEEDVVKGYEAQAAAFSQAFTKVLYVAFGNDGKPRPEADAKTKGETLRKQAQEGGDFLALIEKESDDPKTKSAKGDYPPMKRSDALPDAIKQAIFSLKPGEYTEPIRQAGGFYIFRLERMERIPLADVRNQIIGNIRQERFNKWFQDIRNSVSVKIENEPFFQPGSGVSGAPVPPAPVPPAPVKPQ